MWLPNEPGNHKGCPYPYIPPSSMIGIFDSGIGGLSVLRPLRDLLPHEPLIYLADQAHVPYGARPPAEICALSEAITRFLLAQGAELVVVACNTATAAALTHLRAVFPDVPFVGMEPAVKPAARLTKTGVVGALATANTFKSQRYASLLARFAEGVRLVENPCVGLVERIERGELATAETETYLRAILEPMLAEGVDVLILGCTHYPFVRPLLERIAGSEVVLVDPAPAVARQVARLLAERPRGREDGKKHATELLTAYSTADSERLHAQIQDLLGWDVPTLHVELTIVHQNRG